MQEFNRLNAPVSMASEANAGYPGYEGQGFIEQKVRRDEQGRAYIPQFFSYPRSYAIAGGAAFSTSDVIQIQADAQFAIRQMQYCFFENATPAPSSANRLIPNGMLVQLTDTGSSSNLFNGLMPITSIFGDGLLPYILPVPKLLAASSTLQISLTTNGVTLSANASTLILVFTGEKRYYL